MLTSRNVGRQALRPSILPLRLGKDMTDHSATEECLPRFLTMAVILQ